VIAGSTLVVFIYCLSNYSWDLQHTDFRPFAVDVEIRSTLEAEQAADANVKVEGSKLTNKSDQ
jgi:hypothetical protein